MQPSLAGFTISTDAGGPAVLVSGEIDLSNAHEFEEHLRDAAGDGRLGLIVSLEDVTFCDTSGLRAMIRAHGLLPIERPLHVVLPKGACRKVFVIARLDTVFACFDTFNEALRSAQSRSNIASGFAAGT
jgi:anti-anti-sigma factor